MVDLSTVPHHPAIENIVDVLCLRTENNDRRYFRPVVAFQLMSMAATMRAKVRTLDQGDIPINGYVAALSTSGSGKGLSMGILENEIFGDFRRTFIDFTLPTLAEASLWRLASQRAIKNGTDEQVEFDRLKKDYDSTGEYIFSFDEAHPAAVKQIRNKLLLSTAGAINFIVDEIGSNLEKIAPAMPLFLELYDQGRAKEKLYMNSNERKRVAVPEGKTPTNMLLFGTPAKLFDGSSTENLFYSLLETGLARRMIFALGTPQRPHHTQTHEEIFDALCDPARHSSVQDMADHFAALADESKFEWTVMVPREVGIELLAYKHQCQDRAESLPEYLDIRKAELQHRYFKTLKLAGAFAFVEEELTMTLAHLHAAMKLVEESGKNFEKILSREKPYQKLAQYISSCAGEVTHADLLEDLPFYPSGIGPRNDILTMATAWGYRNHILIKKRYVDNVEFFSADALKKTSLDLLSLAYSSDFATDYEPVEAEFSQLEQLVTMENIHWTAHCFEGNHRAAANVIPGFNLAVFDLDGSTSLNTVHELLEDYTFMTYTTKRHTPEHNRFRLIMPLSYWMQLDQEDYRQFMTNIMAWLPFDVDDDKAGKDIARKWLTNPRAKVHYNITDKLLDVLPFVPRTTRNDTHQKEMKALGSLDALERWFAHRFMEGDRNNQMLRFAMALVDSGMSYSQVEAKVLSFNAKIADKLPEDELQRTVLVTVAKKIKKSAA